MIHRPHTDTGIIDISKYSQEKGVYHTSENPVLPKFIQIFHKACKKEHRLYSEAQLVELPKAFAYNVHYKEWAQREKSLKRFLKYLSRKKEYLYILDVGCGNGWFTDKIAKNQAHQVFGLDVHLHTLEQAATVFQQPNLHFFYGDIQDDIFPRETFDLLILNKSIEYFPDLYALIQRCFQLLKLGGEIHIIDSPIYKPSEIDAAHHASEIHYEELNLKEMTNYVHHHSTDDLLAFRHKFLHKPGGLKNFFSKEAGDYPWVRIIKDEEL